MIRHILLILKRSNIVKSTVSHVILNQITLLFFFLKQLQFFWKVYLDPTQKPAPSWLVSSIGRALHWYRRGHGFKSHTGLNFFFFPPGLISTTCLVVFIAARIAYNLDHLPPQTIVGYSRQIIKEAIRKLKMATRINYINGDCLWQTPWLKVSVMDSGSQGNPPGQFRQWKMEFALYRWASLITNDALEKSKLHFPWWTQFL